MQNPTIGSGRARAFAFVVLTALFGATAFAQETKRLDIDQAVALALENNLSLQSANIDLGAAKRGADNAFNSLIPTVEIGGSLVRSNVATTASGVSTEGLTPSIPGTPIYDQVIAYSYDVPRWHASASISATLNLNAGLFDAMKALRQNYATGKLTYEKAKAQLELNVRKSYYSILLLEQQIDLMEGNLAAAERRVQQAEANFRAGLVPELTVLQARVAAANIKPSLADLRNALDASLGQFAMTLGLKRGTKIELGSVTESGYVELDPEKLISQASSSRLDILTLRSSISGLESQRKGTFYQLYTPTLSLAWNADPTLAGDPWKDSWFGTDWEQSSGMFRATLGFRLNGLLPFSSEASGLKEIDENISKLNINLAQAVRGMELEIDSTLQSLEKSRTSADSIALNVELARRAYQLSEDAYKAGAKDLLDVQNAELDLKKAQLDSLREKFNYVTGLLDLEYAVGVPFGTLSGSAK